MLELTSIELLAIDQLIVNELEFFEDENAEDYAEPIAFWEVVQEKIRKHLESNVEE